MVDASIVACLSKGRIGLPSRAYPACPPRGCALFHQGDDSVGHHIENGSAFLTSLGFRATCGGEGRDGNSPQLGEGAGTGPRGSG